MIFYPTVGDFGSYFEPTTLPTAIARCDREHLSFPETCGVVGGVDDQPTAISRLHFGVTLSCHFLSTSFGVLLVQLALDGLLLLVKSPLTCIKYYQGLYNLSNGICLSSSEGVCYSQNCHEKFGYR